MFCILIIIHLQCRGWQIVSGGEEVTQIIIPYSCWAPGLNKGVWLLLWAFWWLLELGRTRVGCSFFTDDRIGLLALLLKTNALYKAHVDPHQSIYPPIHPPVHLYFLSIPIYPVILQERKKEKGSFGKEAHPCVWTQFCTVFSRQHCHQLRDLQPCPPCFCSLSCFSFISTADWSSASSVHLQSCANKDGNILSPLCPSAHPPGW